MNISPFIFTDGSRASLDRFESLARDFYENEALRARMVSDPRGVLLERGMNVPADVEIQVLMDTETTHHVVFPPDPNAALSDESLNVAAGGKDDNIYCSYGASST